MVRKTASNSKTTEKIEAPKKAAPKKTPPKPTVAQAGHPVFSLNVGHNFTLLTQDLEGGSVVVHAPVGAGAALKVWYWKEPHHLDRHNVSFVSVKLHARIDGGAEMVCELGREEGRHFVRMPAIVELGAEARHFEYWFELVTSAGETLWDSNWANNYWLSVAPPAIVGPVEVLFDANTKTA